MRQAAAVSIAYSEKPEDRQRALESAVPAVELPFAGEELEEAQEAPERVGNGFVQEQWWPDATLD